MQPKLWSASRFSILPPLDCPLQTIFQQSDEWDGSPIVEAFNKLLTE